MNLPLTFVACYGGVTSQGLDLTPKPGMCPDGFPDPFTLGQECDAGFCFGDASCPGAQKCCGKNY